MSILEEDLISNIIRVKTLDQSDIESLGWVNSEKLNFTEDTWILRKFEDGLIICQDYSNGKFKYPWLYEDSTDKIFEGIIKNKSELIKLMQQLNKIICKQKVKTLKDHEIKLLLPDGSIYLKMGVTKKKI